MTLVHVFNDSTWASIKAVYDLSSWAASSPVESARQRLETICAGLARDYGVPVDAEVLVGRASQEIHKFAMSRQAGLLVLGEHGENWIKDVVLGGTALKVLEATHIPVLLVRRPAAGSYRRILIATDFCESATRTAHLATALFPAPFLIHAYVAPFEASMHGRCAGRRYSDADTPRGARPGGWASGALRRHIRPGAAGGHPLWNAPRWW